MRLTYAEQLAQFVAQTAWQDIPSRVKEQAALSLLDTVGAMLAAWEEPSTAIAVSLVRRQGGRRESTIMVAGKRVPATEAAFCHGIMAHSNEMDNHTNHRRSLNHPGVTAIPPALAVGEKLRARGADVLLAIILGYEVSGRLSLPVEPGWFNYRRGFHETAICGVFGACAAAGKLLGLDAAQLASAFGICGSLAAGLYEFKASGAWTKRLHAGHASRSGVIAAYLAAEGFTGPHTVFEGKAGFYHAYAGEGHYRLERMLADLGSDWELDHIQYKPYACAGVLHAALTATQDLLAEHPADPAEVDHVLVETSSTVADGYAQPNHYHLSSPVDAQFSLPYAVAAMIRWGRALPAEFSEPAVRDREVRALTGRVQCRSAEDIDREWPGRDRARVTFYLRDGKVLSRQVECPKGELERPLAREEIVEKYRQLSSYVLDREQVTKLEDMCLGVDRLPDISPLLAATVVPRGRGG